MATINSVTGPLELAELGVTLVHEHLRTCREQVMVQFPHLYVGEAEEATFSSVTTQISAVHSKGVRTICDPTVMGIGRNVRFMRRVADATGMHIIAATGVFTVDELPPYFVSRPIDYLADVFVHDIEVGIQGTDIKAGFLKCATDKPGVTPNVEKVLRAVARAHRRTGVPIMTHSLPSVENGLVQQDIFEDEGVDLARVMIGHCGDTDIIPYLEKVAERGSYLGMDRYGLSDILPTDRRNATVAEMCRLGYSDRVMISQDVVCAHEWVDDAETQRQRERWTMTYIVDEIIPQLRLLAVPQASIDTMMTGNVRNWLNVQQPY